MADVIWEMAKGRKDPELARAFKKFSSELHERAEQIERGGR